MRKQILIAGFALLSTMVPFRASAKEPQFDSFFTLGDSTTDRGRLYGLTNGNAPQSPPFYPGRFTNGPVWSEYLETLIGATSSKNYALPGATTGDFNVRSEVDRQDLPGFLDQVDELIREYPSADPNALYGVWVGTNDFVYAGVTDPTQTVDNVITGVNKLIDYGAKNILVNTLPALGDVPWATLRSEETANNLRTLIQQHNSGLSDAIEDLNQTLDPSTKVVLFDAYSLYIDAIKNPGKYGFTNSTVSCVGDPVKPSLSLSEECSADPSKFLFIDDIHFTTDGYKVVADSAYSTLKSAYSTSTKVASVPEPSTESGILVLGALGAGSILLRIRYKQRRLAHTHG